MSPDLAAAAGGTPVEVYVSPDGNAFMADIAAWIAEAAAICGHQADIVADGRLPGEGPAGAAAIALVVAPHEFYELSSRPRRDLIRAARSSTPVATEQPGTSWFEASLDWCRRSEVVLDINDVGVAAMSSTGMPAQLLRLGAVPSMDHRASSRGGERRVDVAVLAGLTEHRARRLASMAPSLWSRRCRLLLGSTGRPMPLADRSTGGGLVFGEAKYELLADSRILLNLHRDGATRYFEWARVVEAMANGCVVVTEPSDATEPLVDGTHIIVSDDPAAAIDELLADQARLDAIGHAAAGLVHGDLALSRHLAPLLPGLRAVGLLLGDGIQRSPRRVGFLLGDRIQRSPRRVGFLLGDGIQRSPRRVGFLLGDGIQRPRSERAFRPHREVRRRLLDAVLAERVLRRQIDATRCQRSHGSADHVDVAETPTWAAAAADVSAIITLYDYADVVTEALDSLAASEDVDVEVVVVDDHSTDDGPAIVRAWMDQHPHVPVRLVARGANRGLAAARNLAIEHTRADRVMVLDADNAVYPTCLRRLADALDADTEAAFAWSILEVVGDEPGLLSAHAWDRDRLLERNRIDAQVMLRRSAIGSLGGYRTPEGLLLGWEDWDLWLRLVEEGGHGVLVPEMLGRYRSHEGSMVSGPNLFDDVMLERLEAAHPDLDFPPR